MSTPVASLAYLVTGYLDPQKTKGDRKHPKAGTLVPVSGRYFSYLNDKKLESLVATDDKGLLHSFNANLEPLHPKQNLTRVPLQLNVLPQGLARQAFFANLENWQKVLIDEVRKAKLECAYKTILIPFEKKDLKKPEEEDEAGIAAYGSFKEGVKYSGHLFPRLQAVVFLVPARIMSGEKAPVKLRRDGKDVTGFQGKGNAMMRKFDMENSLSNAVESAEYVCYSYSSVDQSIAEGFYTLEIPAASLKKDRFPAGSPVLTAGLRFGCDVKFSIRTLTGDFDYHVLHPVSVESALLSNFPDSFAHLQQALFAQGGGGGDAGASKTAKTTLQSWAEGYEWTHAKRQLALGYINAENEGRIKDLAKAALDSILETDSDSLRHSAQLVKGFWDLGEKGPALVKGWKKVFDSLRIIEENQGKLKLVRQAVDANFFTRVFKETRWQRYVIAELREAEKLAKAGKPVTNRFVLQLAKKEASLQALRKLMKDGIPREAENFEKLFGSGSQAAAKALWFLDVTFTAYSVASAVKDLSQKGAEAEVQERRLSEALIKYAEKQKGSTHPLVLERLDGLRKLSDSARMGLTDAEQAAVKNAVEFTLKAAVVVPVVGEMAGLVVLGMEAYDLLKGLTNTALGVYFGDAHANRKRLDLLDKEYAANVRILLATGMAGHEKNLTVQFRLRALALIGFLRLLHRCGSRLQKKEDFARKLKEYRLEEYLQTYLLGAKPVKFPVYAGLPIDQLWVYSNPGKNPEWKENWNGTAYPSIPGGAYTLDFQGHFPIHGMDTASIVDLAETFCLDFAGAVTAQTVHGMVYARKDGKSAWTPARQCDFSITPLTEIRVIVLFKGEKDLTGIPLSIQLIRTDSLPDVYGPVYKTLVVQAKPSLDGQGEDQGLLESEKQFADGKHYCAVFHPMYTFRETIYKGVKPLGHIGVVANPKIEVAFKVGAGTGGQKAWIQAGRGETRFTVHMPLSLSPMVQMIVEKPFLQCRSDKQEFRKLFFDTYKPRYIGVLLKKADSSYVYFPGTVKELKRIDFGFGWDQSFEMLLLFHSRAHAEGWEQQKPIRFPAFIQTKEFTGIDTVGPDYPAEVYSLRTHQVQRPGTVTVASLGEELKELGLVKMGAALPGGLVEFQEPGYLWACLAKFTYSLEENPDEVKTKDGFKPFSGTFVDKEGEYTFGFSISTPDPLGLNIEDFLEVKVPGLPEGFLGTTSFGQLGLHKKMVTEKRVHRSLNIRQVDLK